MKFTVKTIKNLDVKSIFNEIFPNLKKIFVEFSEYGLTKDEIMLIVMKEIEESKKSYNGDDNYLIFIQNCIQKKLSSIVKTKLEDNAVAVSLLNNYINSNLDKMRTKNQIISFFDSLNIYLGKIEYIPNLEVLTNLLNNNKILKVVIDKFYKVDQNIITNGKIDDTYHNYILAVNN